MKNFLNTLFVLTPESYLALDGENVVIQGPDGELARFPLHRLENILCFSYKGASPALLGACAQKEVGFCFLTPGGHFLARVCGETRGNVLLRQKQYAVCQDAVQSCSIARCMIAAKLLNSRWVLERATRDHALRMDVARVKAASAALGTAAKAAACAEEAEVLRGIEGEAASRYFGVLDELILQDKTAFFLRTRNRRPPLDNMNAALSFAYSLLGHDCASALEAVGLDPYVGVLHGDRPGRTSLALDLMEELRPCYADRFVLSCVNTRVLRAEHFTKTESGAVWLNQEGRKLFLDAYQRKKRELITHPFLGEKLAWGLVPYVQSLLLARTLRGDLDAYPPFLWK
ncbi:MAG: type I-C CRISPR-associated endonuclease Cas1c [Eubacteriales bacterium]|nr:type I-C CRISPR-associated endonuclease Cas1c [Eubacteriales bacterium]